MTVPSTPRRAGPFNGNGIAVSFPFTFKVFADTDIEVIKTSTAGVESTLVLDADYSVTRNPDQDATPGGSITYPLSGSLLATGEKLTLIGATEYTQELDLTGGGNFNPVAIENALDRQEFQIQQVRESVQRTLQLAVSAPSGVSTAIPSPESNALLAWNAAGDGLQNVDPTTLATIVAFGTAVPDVFTGDGTTTEFALTANPGALGNLDVAVGGVTQTPGVDYTWSSGTALTFASAPPLGATVLVRYIQALPQGSADSAASTFAQSGAGAVAQNVQTKLRRVSADLEDFGGAGDGVTDNLAAFNKAKAAGVRRLRLGVGDYRTSAPFVLDKEGFELVGDSMTNTILQTRAGFAGVATVDVNGARLQSIRNIHVRGDIAAGADAIRITDGPMTNLDSVLAKTGAAGVRLISGNAQRWRNVYAESNTDGVVVAPDAGDNTNGCVVVGVRAYNNTNYGLDIQQGAGAKGHMHSTWDISTEHNGKGVRIRKGLYCNFTLYSEANTGANYDLDSTVAHFYFLKNPDGSADGALFSDVSYSAGYDFIGGNIQLDLGIARNRVTKQVFSASASLAGVGVKTYYVSNTSGGTRNMTLSFLSYAPVGFACEIIKTDGTAGLTPVAPGGITLVGATGTFGAFVAAGSAATLRVVKIDASTAVLY